MTLPVGTPLAAPTTYALVGYKHKPVGADGKPPAEQSVHNPPVGADGNPPAKHGNEIDYQYMKMEDNKCTKSNKKKSMK